MSDSHTLGEDKNIRAPCVPPVWGGRERCRCHPFSQSKARTNPQGTQLPVLPSPQAALTLLPRSDKEQGPRALGIRWTLCPSAGTAAAINPVPARGEHQAGVTSSGSSGVGTQVVPKGRPQGRICSPLASGGVAQPFWALPAQCAQLSMPLLSVPRAGVTPEFPVIPPLPYSRGGKEV